jgi:Flp pilus assembly protein CpaB
LRRTSRLVLLAGVFLAALTFVVFILLGGGGGGGGIIPTPTPPPAELPTVVASVDIPLGSVITADMLTTRTISVDSRENGALGDVSQAIGKIVATNIATGGQVTTGDFLVRNVELTVPAGRRAMAIAVNELSGVAALVTTGDTVDVLVTLKIGVTQVLTDGSISVVPGINPLTTKLLLQDIQVIGKLDQYVPPAEGSTTPARPGFVGEFPAGSKILILAVTAAQAEVLVFARNINAPNTFGSPDAPNSQIDLILRSPEDAGIVETTEGVILKTLIDTYGVLPPEVILVPVPTQEP